MTRILRVAGAVLIPRWKRGRSADGEERKDRCADMKKETTVIEFEAGDGVEKRFIGKRYRLQSGASLNGGCRGCAFRPLRNGAMLTRACKLVPGDCLRSGSLIYVEDAP